MWKKDTILALILLESLELLNSFQMKKTIEKLKEQLMKLFNTIS